MAKAGLSYNLIRFRRECFCFKQRSFLAKTKSVKKYISEFADNAQECFKEKI